MSGKTKMLMFKPGQQRYVVSRREESCWWALLCAKGASRPDVASRAQRCRAAARPLRCTEASAFSWALLKEPGERQNLLTETLQWETAGPNQTQSSPASISPAWEHRYGRWPGGRVFPASEGAKDLVEERSSSINKAPFLQLYLVLSWNAFLTF